MARQLNLVCIASTVHRAGDTRIYFKQARALLAAGYDIAYYARKDTRPLPAHASAGKLEYRAVPSFARLWLRLAYSFCIMPVRLLACRARVLHIHDAELIPAGLLCRIFGKQVIYDIHEDGFADIKQKNIRLRRIVESWYHRLHTLAARHFRLILAEDSYAPRYTKARHSPLVIHNYVDTRLISLAERSNAHPPAFFLVGTLEGGRGLIPALRALIRLHRKGIVAGLIAVGEVSAGLQAALNDIAGYEDIKAGIQFTGRLPVNEAYMYASACVGGLALLSDLPNHRESYPTKLFEYPAAGLPVIASDFPLYIETVEKNGIGICVPPEDDAAIAAAMEKILQSSYSPSALRRVAELYSWESELPAFLRLYEELSYVGPEKCIGTNSG